LSVGFLGYGWPEEHPGSPREERPQEREGQGIRRRREPGGDRERRGHAGFPLDELIADTIEGMKPVAEKIGLKGNL
jgi:hypothetical protein